MAAGFSGKPSGVEAAMPPNDQHEAQAIQTPICRKTFDLLNEITRLIICFMLILELASSRLETL